MNSSLHSSPSYMWLRSSTMWWLSVFVVAFTLTPKLVLWGNSLRRIRIWSRFLDQSSGSRENRGYVAVRSSMMLTNHDDDEEGVGHDLSADSSCWGASLERRTWGEECEGASVWRGVVRGVDDDVAWSTSQTPEVTKVAAVKGLHVSVDYLGHFHPPTYINSSIIKLNTFEIR